MRRWDVARLCVLSVVSGRRCMWESGLASRDCCFSLCRTRLRYVRHKQKAAASGLATYTGSRGNTLVRNPLNFQQASEANSRESLQAQLMHGSLDAGAESRPGNRPRLLILRVPTARSLHRNAATVMLELRCSPLIHCSKQNSSRQITPVNVMKFCVGHLPSF